MDQQAAGALGSEQGVEHAIDLEIDSMAHAPSLEGIRGTGSSL